MIWMCLRGGEEKCSDTSSKGSNRMQPLMSLGLRTCHSLKLSSEDGIGGDTFSKIRSSHRLKTGALTHFPEIKSVKGKFVLHLLRYDFLQLGYCLVLLNFNQEGIGRVEIQAAEADLA
jgi:hypothetical protein